MFSRRTPDDLSPNSIAVAMDQGSADRILDLTESNPTRCGFDYPAGLLNPLGQNQALIYEPSPLGHPKARNAVARFLSARRKQAVDPEKIVLAASTSEAYSFLFKLLGNPGDSFLTPVPGYPLLEHLARLESVELLPYRLQMKPGWPLERDTLEAAGGPETKGLITVDPHNPTGCFLGLEDRKWAWNFCRRRSLAFISDEVFADYADEEFEDVPPPREVLSFRMGGLSKSLGLPQLKLSWMVLDGPPALLAECRERLELIADTYLSVNTPVQLALDELFRFTPLFQRQLKDRILANRSFLAGCFKSEDGIRIWPSQGGWYALMEITGSTQGDADLVVELLRKKQVLVQPGAFYDFPRGCFLVLSLLPLPSVFQEGARRIRDLLK